MLTCPRCVTVRMTAATGLMSPGTSVVTTSVSRTTGAVTRYVLFKFCYICYAKCSHMCSLNCSSKCPYKCSLKLSRAKKNASFYQDK